MAQVSTSRAAVFLAVLTSASFTFAQEAIIKDTFTPALAGTADFRDAERRDFLRPIRPKAKTDAVLAIEHTCRPAEKYPLKGLPLLALRIEDVENDRIKAGGPFDISVVIVNPCDAEIWIPWTISPADVEQTNAPYSFSVLRLELEADLGPLQQGHERVVHVYDLLALFGSASASFTEFRLGPKEFVRIRTRFVIPQSEDLLMMNLPRDIRLSVRGYVALRSVDADRTYSQQGWFPLQGIVGAPSIPTRLEQQ